MFFIANLLYHANGEEIALLYKWNASFYENMLQQLL